MERRRETNSESEDRTRREVVVRRPQKAVAMPARTPESLAVDLNVRLRSVDMPAAMQERAFRFTRQLLDKNNNNNNDSNKLNPTHLALSLKKEFDKLYGPAWHCIVGKSFGSFVTHSSGGFVYFSVEKLSFLLFKTQVRPVKSTPRLR